MTAPAPIPADPLTRAWQAIADAMYGDLPPRPEALTAQLAKRGLMLVEANASINPDLAGSLKLVEAVWTAISRSRDGYPGVEIGEQLAKRGLLVVETSAWDAMRATLQMIASLNASNSPIAVAIDAARVTLNRIGA